MVKRKNTCVLRLSLFNESICVTRSDHQVETILGRAHKNGDDRVNLLMSLEKNFVTEVEMLSGRTKKVVEAGGEAAKFIAALFLAPLPKTFYVAHRVGFLTQQLSLTRDVLANCPDIPDRTVKKTIEQLANAGVICCNGDNSWSAVIDFSAPESAPDRIRNSLREFFA